MNTSYEQTKRGGEAVLEQAWLIPEDSGRHETDWGRARLLQLCLLEGGLSECPDEPRGHRCIMTIDSESKGP